VPLDASSHAALLGVLDRRPDTAVTVNLDEQCVEAGSDFRASFDIDPFTRRCLRDGVDELGFLVQAMDDIADWERHRLPPSIDTTQLVPGARP
jgi:3-isopropylmalate/(R)-2-methylmalate dehydratase small subunit